MSPVIDRQFVLDFEVLHSFVTANRFDRGLKYLVELLQPFAATWAVSNLRLREFSEATEIAQVALSLVVDLKFEEGVTPITVFQQLEWPDSPVPTQAEGKQLLLFVPLTSEPETRADEAVANAFDKTRFIDLGGSLKELRDRLSKCAHLWQAVYPFYAPYLVLINASMTGKSRLIAQLRTLGIFLITVCLRPDTDKHLRPRRTEPVARWIEESVETPPLNFLNQCCAFNFFAIQSLGKWLADQPQSCALEELTCNWYAYLAGDDSRSAWAEIVRQAKEAAMKTKEDKGVYSVKLSEGLIESWRTDIKVELGKLSQVLRRRFPENLIGADSDVRVLFVVDEARNLNSAQSELNRFLFFRWSLQAIPYFENDLLKVFAIFTDTMSKVANLAPPSEVDPSGRLFSKNSILFPPFVVLNTVDLWWQYARHVRLPLGTANTATAKLLVVLKTLKDVHSAEGLTEVVFNAGSLFQECLTMEVMDQYFFNALTGRPAYAAFLIQKTKETAKSPALQASSEEAAAVLHSSLRTKLLCGFADTAAKRKVAELDEEDVVDFESIVTGRGLSSMTKSNPKFTQAQALGVFGAIASIEVSASSRLATELSSGHMRLISAISKLRKFVYTKEVSEPVLALAGHSLIAGGLSWENILERYVHSQLNQSTMTGFLGEVAYEVLLLMAWQRCLDILVAAPFVVPFIPVFLFLEVLFGTQLNRVSKMTAKTLEHMRGHLAGGWVRVNQIVLTISDLSINMLCDYVIRASVVRCKPGQKAVDYVVPIFFPKSPVTPDSLAVHSHSSSEALAADLRDQPCTETAVHFTPSDRGAKFIESVKSDASKKAVFSPDGISEIGIQVKDRKNFMTTADKKKWLDSLDRLSFLDANAYLPSVVICAEFDSGDSAEASDSWSKSIESLPLVARSQLVKKTALFGCQAAEVEHTRYVMCTRRPKPSDIDQSLRGVDQIFQHMLEYNVDIFKSGNIDAADARHSKESSQVQPEYREKTSWGRRDRSK